MKKALLYLPFICLIVLFASCNKKDNNTSNTDFYISAKVDGVQKTYKTNAVAVKLQVDTTYSIELLAYGNVATQESFSLTIAQANKPITTGTYIDANQEDLLVVSGYNPGTTDDSKLFGAGLQEDNNPRLHITISALTASNVSGTFYGTYYDDGGDGTGTAAVTEGSFNLPVH